MAEYKPLIAPYRSIGLFIDENKPFIFNLGNKKFLLASTSHSFKLYKLPEMKVKLLGPNLPKKVRAVCAYGENIFLGCGNQIYHFKHYHLVNTYEKTQHKISCLLNIGEILVVGSHGGEIVAFDITNHLNVLCSFKLDFSPKVILHPPTYLNKVLIMGDKELELRNLRTTDLIYNFMEENSALYKLIEKRLDQTQTYINKDAINLNRELTRVSSITFLCIQNSPALDVVSLGLSNGEILLYNLKQNQILQAYKLKDSRPISLTFSQADIPLLAAGSDNGNITVFNLNDESVLSTMRDVHKSSINFLEFLKDELILLSGSFSDNSVIMWQYDELENSKFRILRKRNGLSEPIRKLAFYGEEGHHVLASSFSEQAEIKDFFLWNEGFEGNFATKRNKSLSRMSFNTENLQKLSQIIDFAFSENRAKDWANLLTCHKNFDKPYLWSTEDHTLIKKNIQWDDPPLKTVQITKVFVTHCGTFGIIGYSNGTIVKINMQSGNLQKVFKQKAVSSSKTINLPLTELHTSSVVGLFVDPYNSVLISAEEYYLINWDFYSGKINKVAYTYPSKITLLKSSKTSSLFCVVFEEFKIELYDQYSFNKGRVFEGHKNRVIDVCFTKDNKQIISCSLDCTLKIWDIISNQIINNLQLKIPIISMDFDPSGDFLVTAFSNSKEVFIWNNRIGRELMGNSQVIPIKFISEIQEKASRESRKKYFKEDSNEAKISYEVVESDLESLEEFFKSQKDSREENYQEGLVEFFEHDIGKWLPLINFDEIREKNKPKQAVENNITAPFFLEFDTRFSALASRMEGKIEEENTDQKDKLKTRFMKPQNKNKFLEEVASSLEKLINRVAGHKQKEKLYTTIFQELQKLSPAQVDYEIRMLTFGNTQNIEAFLDFFNYLFNHPDDYDLKQIYFNNFLKICSDTLVMDDTLSSKVQEIRKNINLYWKNLNNEINSAICMIQHFAKIKT